MRSFYKILALLSIIATMVIVCSVITLYANQVHGQEYSINWNFTIPAISISAFVLIVAASGVMTIATNSHVWKKLEQLQADEEALRRERMDLMELKEKLVSKVVNSQEVCRYKG